MNDLMSKGMSDQVAFNKASEEMRLACGSAQSADLSEHFNKYYENRSSEDYEVIGLFYGGFTVIGLTSGSIIGFLTSGVVAAFLDNGWIYTLIGLVAGVLIGAGLGQIAHGIIAGIKRK